MTANNPAQGGVAEARSLADAAVQLRRVSAKIEDGDEMSRTMLDLPWSRRRKGGLAQDRKAGKIGSCLRK